MTPEGSILSKREARPPHAGRPESGQIVVFRTQDGRAQVDVSLKEDTVWLSQKQMAGLFATERSVITKHIHNIFRSSELQKTSVCAFFAHTAADGKVYRTSFYNLDMIISVGYRVNSKRGKTATLGGLRILDFRFGIERIPS